MIRKIFVDSTKQKTLKSVNVWTLNYEEQSSPINTDNPAASCVCGIYSGKFSFGWGTHIYSTHTDLF